MAELLAAGSALGVASSLITFGDVAWRVLKRLKEYCDRTKDVPTVIKHIIPQLEVLAKKLEESEKIRQAENGASVATSSQSSPSGFMVQFKEHVCALDELTAKMLPMKDDSRRVRAKKAVLSIYYEKELSKIWGVLEQYKTTFLVQHTNLASPPVSVLELTATTTHYQYPASVVSHLVTREIPLRQIGSALSNPQATTNPRILVVLGLGGCGKTQLALQYCRQSEAERRFSGIFWVDASSPTAAAQSFAKIASLITDNKVDPSDFEANILVVKDRLSTWTERWLLVFDNFDDPHAFESRDIRGYFPHGENGAILFTSRHGDAKRLGQHIRIDEMLESEGLELLFRQAGCEKNESNSMVAKDIIARLGNLALAIDQAGAYISARGLPLRLFMDHYDRRRDMVLKEIPETLWEYKRKLKDAEKETSLSVFTTWELSFEQLNRNTASGRIQEHLITLSAFFSSEDIFEDLFKKYFESQRPGWMRSLGSDGSWDSFEFQDLVAQLAKLSLISNLQITAAGAHFSLHPLVQDWIKLRSDKKGRQKNTAEAIYIISHYISNRDGLEMPLNLRQVLLLHVTASVQNEAAFLDPDNGFESPALIDAADAFATFYQGQARLKEAEVMCNRALAGKEKALGPDHPSTLVTVNNLAILYANQGQLAEAESMYDRALAGMEKALGPEHSSTLNTVHGLADLYADQGQLAEAEAMYDRALAGKEKELGPDHTSTLATVNNLAILYRGQGRLSEAETLLDRALGGKEKALGPDHPSTLKTVHNLADLYVDQGRLAEAEAMFDRALAGNEEALGPDHSSTLDTVHGLADFYEDQGRLAEAEAMLDRALAGREKTLGPDHPSTLATVENLATLYKQQGRLAEAEAMFDRVLAEAEEALGPDHSSTLDTVQHFADLYANQGRLAEAEAMFDRALAGKEKILGPEHPSTLNTVHSLADLNADQGRLVEAEALYNRALAGREKALGQGHPSTLDTVNNLAVLYADQGQLSEAKAMYVRALVGKARVLGPNHTSTLQTKNNLADLYKAQGWLAELEGTLARLQLG